MGPCHWGPEVRAAVRSATFTSDGTEPQGDPGHIHSVTYDHVAATHVIFVDRPIVEGVSGPEIYTSSDNGATWALLGESSGVDKPNFVAPMYFQDYIACGSDNQINGRISRIKRTDFYAGNFDKAEAVAMLSQKALYFVFPIRPDVWAITVAGEHIAGPQTGGGGSTMNEVWLVSNNGSLVSGGMESYYTTVAPGNLSGVRAFVPHRKFNVTDHGGLLWAGMPVGRPRAYAAIPATQGWEPPSKRVNYKSVPILPPRVPLAFQRNSTGVDDVVRFAEYTGSQMVLANDVASGTVRSEIRFLDGGGINFTIAGVIVATLPASGAALQIANQRLDLTTTGLGLRAGSGSPEGVVTAPAGTIYQNWGGGRIVSLWVKESGTGNTGWLPVGHTSGPTTSRPASPVAGMHMFDTTIGKPIWYSGLAWVDATGVTI